MILINFLILFLLLLTFFFKNENEEYFLLVKFTIKFDWLTASNLNMSTEDKILKQIEFYFSDSNLPYDKFLRSLVANDPQGFVSLETIGSFKKMKEISTDMKEILVALSKSKMLEVDKDGKNVRRVTPLPESSVQDERSIYAKGFSEDATLDIIKPYFEPFGEVLCVRLRYTKASPEKTFKGSVFVEFSSEKEAKSVVEKEIKVNDTPLKMLMK